MNYRKKILFSTLLASNCLLYTNVVKADTVDQTVNNAISQSMSEQVEKTLNDDVVSTTENSPETSSSSTEILKDDVEKTADANISDIPKSTGEDNNMTSTQTQDSQNNQKKSQNLVYKENLDGVYTTGNQITYLYAEDGSLITNRALGANSAWYTDQLYSTDSGNNYYRVATNEFVNSNNGSYKPYVQPYSGNATVVYKDGSSVHDFEGYGNKATYLGNDLSTGSSWKINNYANIGGKEWYQIGSNTWVPQDYVVVVGGQYKTADWISGVPLIPQRPELPNGCEITAVTMMLQYAGANVDKMQLAHEMPRSGDPNYGYIGQPWDSTGVTIFPNALMSLVEKYAGTAKDLTGQSFDAIKYQINLGHPVVTWNTLHGFPYHALAVTGYDEQYVYYNDCWTNQTTQMEINQFINNWNTQKRRAISY